MQRSSRPSSLDLPQSQTQRNHGLAGDRVSVSVPASASLASPPPVSPDPAYIAASAASQIVTANHQSQIDDWFDESGGKVNAEPITVSSASLILTNGFLDQLLFSILAFARSTSITSLRPAVSEVLKPRLAKDAISGADDELDEFLGGDTEESSSFHNGLEPKGKWDLALVWRRTRLRCMVYTRLGDMEEEDEETYIERERMEDVDNVNRRISRDLGMISPAAAIWLTSILEFIGEHALTVAGEAASNRNEIKLHRDESRPSMEDEPPRLVVEDIDVEKLAFNTTLGRLWRSWKKRVRAPSISSIRPTSREVVRRRALSTSASPSISEADEPSYFHDTIQRPSVEVLEEEQEPPRTSKDNQSADATDPDGIEPTDSVRTGLRSNRPHSMMVYTQASNEMPPISDQPYLPEHPGPSRSSQFYPRSRKRSSSLPTPIIPYESPWYEMFNTPVKKLETSKFGAHDDLFRHIPPLEEDPNFISEDDYLSDPDSMISDDNRDGIDLGTLSGYTGPQLSPGIHSITGEKSRIKVPNGDEEAQSMGAFKFPFTSNRSSDLPQIIAEGPIPVERVMEGTARLEVLKDGDPVTDLYESRAIKNESTREHDDYHSPTNGEQTEEKPEVEKRQLNLLPSTTLAMLQGQKSQAETTPNPQSDPASPHQSKEFHGQDLRATPVKTTIYTSGPEYGVPSPTPLRQSMETAQDSSGDSSSIEIVHDLSKRKHSVPTERSLSNDPPSPRSFSSSTLSQTKHPLGGSKDLDRHREVKAVNTVGTERAAVQRITHSPVFARDSGLPAARTSTSSNRDIRPHTSASGTSQLSHKIKGLIGRESVDGIVQPVATRNSSGDSGSSLSDKPSANGAKPLTKQQSFEQLIKSDETIQYTLTPKNMRDMETADNSKIRSDYSSEAVAIIDSHRSNEAIKADLGARPTAGRSVVSIKGMNGLRSNPPPVSSKPNSKQHGSLSSRGPTIPSDSVKPRTLSASTNGLVPRSGRSSANGRHNIEPRDARAKKETTSEIADFIRSTGPEIIPRNVPSSNTPPGDSREASGSQRSSSRRISKPYSGIATGTPKRTKSKLQAREPTISYDSQTSDLIDFIRQGPAHDRTDGSHRIPRSVAPFRRTMDSDEIQALGNGRARETSSVASTQDSLANTKSIHSSSNSRTGLLENSRRSNIKHSNVPLTISKPPRLDEPPHPPRKRYRQKDPYAIDSDSDQEDENSRSKAPRNEETLIDFLRSGAPQAELHIPSAFDGVPKPIRNTSHQRGSGDAIPAQAVRTASSHSSKTTGSKNTVGAASTSSSTRKKNGLPPPSPRETSPHLITQNGTKLDTYKPTKPTYAAHIDRQRNGTHRGHQARAEREPDSSISELADFFKNSGPPAPPIEKLPTPAIGPGSQKEEGGFGRIFSRKKRSTGRL